jgi:enoyl-CoA hydratase/carnithine racemase
VLRVTENLRVDVAGAVATLTIDRPERRNAMSFAMWSALPELLAGVRDHPDVRALVVRGAGGVFSAGADISEFRTLRAGPDGARRYSDAVHAGERALAEFGRPTIAAITGFCIGGGCELALACDLRVAADDARFGITPAKLGIVYHATSTNQLVDAVGPAWAKQILFTGDILDAATALRIGLVNELTPADGLDARVAELTATIASRSPVSVAAAKTIIGKITAGVGERGEDDEVRALYDTAVLGPDYAEGVSAFLEKRTPKF